MNAFRHAPFPPRRQRLPKVTESLSTRAFIHTHLWDHLRLSLTRLPQHRKVLFPDVNRQQIRLQEDGGTCGLTPLPTAMEKHLGPGEALSRLFKRRQPSEQGAEVPAGEDGLSTSSEALKMPFTYDTVPLDEYRGLPKKSQDLK